MSEQPLSALSVSPAVFLVIFCCGDVATYGEVSRNMADHIWTVEWTGLPRPGKKRNGLQMYSRRRREEEIKSRNVS